MMFEFLIKDIEKYLEKHFQKDYHRLTHIYNVKKVAITLAKLYDEDLSSVIVASYLHDATKYLSDEENIKLVGNLKPEIPIACLHAFTAKILAEKEFKIKNKDILNAIKYHCTGRPKMSKLEKIIFVSDYIEEGRSFDIDRFKTLAYKNLDEAVLNIMLATKEYLLNNKQEFSPLTEEAIKYYQEKLEELNGSHSKKSI